MTKQEKKGSLDDLEVQSSVTAKWPLTPGWQSHHRPQEGVKSPAELKIDPKEQWPPTIGSGEDVDESVAE